MTRYEPLRRFLNDCAKPEAPLTFRDIEKIIGRELPPSARQYQAWWSNTATHSHADSWMAIGWRTGRVDLLGERLVFSRIDEAPPIGAASAPPVPLHSPPTDEVTIRLSSLTASARTLLERRIAMQGYSYEAAVADILSTAASQQKKALLERFPLTRLRKGVDSVSLIREDRDRR